MLFYPAEILLFTMPAPLPYNFWVLTIGKMQQLTYPIPTSTPDTLCC